ncbi:DNA-directed RNA polymerase subunit beta [Nocardia brasiliensis]|uniref:DNA-directed RNA polymerase subunit beta n=1 Tax=Nocardia brasiliensis TaxID=37326 RepID=UPI0036712D3B
MNDPVFADTSISRCTYYRRTCGLPAGIHPEAGRIVVKAGVVGAITMPAGLGERVRDDMLFRGCPLGPVVAHIRSRRWTFLCRPDVPDDLRLFAELFRLDVSIVPFGGEIALPSPADARAACRAWVVLPRDTFRPSGAVIIDYVRACTGRQRVR